MKCGWDAKRVNAERPSSHLKYEADAVSSAREVSHNQHTERVTH
ncbi:DUF2188 domain-containing protein [Mesoterricola silvestris]